MGGRRFGVWSFSLGFVLTFAFAAVAAGPYNVTSGSVFEIKASDVGLTTFTSAPTVYALTADKKVGALVLNRGADFKTGLTAVQCAWRRSLPSGAYTLYLSSKQLDAPVSLGDSCLTVQPPIIDELTSIGRGQYQVVGRYFGKRPPTVSARWTDASGRVLTSRCRVVTPLAYPDWKGKAGQSCMDLTTGESSLKFTIAGASPGPRNRSLVLKTPVGVVETAFLPYSMPITYPSANERTFGEQRDFYVLGFFSGPITNPGNVKIEVFEGVRAEGAPVRLVQSHVDATTGVTPESAIDKDYPYLIKEGREVLYFAPDLVKEPGGARNVSNKVVVTNTYYAGVIFGGASKDFMVDYVDADGKPLKALLADTYTVRVTGLSGQLNGLTATVQIHTGLTHALLGRFSPNSTEAKLAAYGISKGMRTFFDPLPGNLWINGKGCEINPRWIPNNAIEVVNYLEGNRIDTVANAVNDFLIYNVNLSCATSTVELVSVAQYDKIDSYDTTYHYYDIGEPALAYADFNGDTHALNGNVATFTHGDRLVLPRAEIETWDGQLQDNYFQEIDPTRKALDLDVYNGVTLTTGQDVRLCGAVGAIPSTVSDIPDSGGKRALDKRIVKIRYVITDDSGAVVLAADKDIQLNRLYAGKSYTTPSYYEFIHEFHFDIPGTYLVNMVGLDNSAPANEIDGTNETFTLTVN